MVKSIRLVEEINNIIKECIAGKRESQHRLYNRFSPKMFGLCLQYMGDYDEAQDVLQEGFIKVFKNLKQFNNKGSFEGWIRKIIINTAIEKFRKKNYLYPLEDAVEYNETYAYDDIIENVSAKDLMNIIQNLSPQYRVVFNLYAIEGYSHKEISIKLNISEGTSKSNLSRARSILQEKVEKHFRVKVKIG
jgi:RNA polymerase sigma factor (sigma-70 family)